MKTNIKRPFKLAKIEIVEIVDCDIITTSPGAFPGGEDEDFDVAGTLYWEQ